MKQNQISANISNETLTKAVALIDELESLFPFLLSLTPDEKQGGFRLGDANMSFLTKSRDYISLNPQHMPSFVDITETNNDINVATNLFTVTKKLAVLASKIEDTATQAGFESLASVLAYYNSVKLAARNNVPGAQAIYDDLKTRFPGRSSTADKKETVK
ncbi:MAG: hypothetical protein Q8928_10305 [Bacteroidota bacterium]|nr:hypothetical protein [Bacteroidota bacterium]